jgi:hypothetical protein
MNSDTIYTSQAAWADEIVPKNCDSAIDHPDYSREWRDALIDELEKLCSLGTFEYAEMPPEKETTETNYSYSP